MRFPKFQFFLPFIALVIIASSCQKSVRISGTGDSVDFNLHIRPILSDRCFKCHGPDANQRKSDLRLDTREGAMAALKDNPSAHVIVPGSAAESEVYLRISTRDTSILMPPPTSNLKLTEDEIEIIKEWINQGAKYKKHWAFIPPKSPSIPQVDQEEWASTDIDKFVLAKQEEAGLTPNPEASKEHLLKRLSFDITGLPPTITMQEKFLKDNSVDAYEKMVDELLARPQYGEKMAIYWMDIARYADTHGYQDDGLRTMWPWRDWVIHAFNKNYSYDQFVTWQLAGDLLPNATKEQILATGFNRNHKITQEGGVVQEEYRVEYVTDRTNTFGKAFLALTFECAHCHDHKYDPISQKAYYSTFAFFNQVPEKGLVGDISLNSLADPPKIKITSKEVEDIFTFINKRDTTPVEVMVMKDSSKRRPTYVLTRGAYDAHGDEVSFGLPDAIFPFDSLAYGTDRLGLSKWLFDKKNPMTSRVFVNRMWQEFFGRGLVKSAGDFGMQGDMPSHPELLDWLSLDFMNNGWDIKRLVKQLVMTSTYRQSSVIAKEKLAKDPENILLSRGPRVRMSAETVRDLALSSSGLLVDEIGGPSMKVYQPNGIWEAATSGRGLSRYVQDHGDNLYRRGLYNFIKRTVPPPGMLVFDGSSRDQCEVKRLRTNTPLQALVLLNDPTVQESSRVFAERLMKENKNAESNIVTAFRTILCRQPKEEEMKLLLNYYLEAEMVFAKDSNKAKELLNTGEYPHESIEDVKSLAALMQVIHTMYNMEEAITKT